MISKMLSDYLKTVVSAKKRALVIGDVGLDCYVNGTVDRISPESPVPVLDRTDIDSDERLGMAANVAANMASLGAIVSIASVVGGDRAGLIVNEMLRGWRVNTDMILVDNKKVTPEKTRFVANGHQLLRVDQESTNRSVHADALKDKILHAIHNTDVVVVEDYSKGVVQNDLMEAIIKEARIARKAVLVDPSAKASMKNYIGCTAITPNTKEAEALCGIKPDAREPATVKAAIKRMIDGLSRVDHAAPMVFLTLGAGGIAAMINGEVEIRPTVAQRVFDVSGAGDTVIALLGLAFAEGAVHMKTAIELANIAAGVVVGKPGTAVVTDSEIEAAIWSTSLRGIKSNANA